MARTQDTSDHAAVAPADEHEAAPAAELPDGALVLEPDMATKLAALRQQVRRETPRLARLGAWSVRTPDDALVERLPTLDDHRVSLAGLGGFDAGVACALDLVPRDRQPLSAKLHAAWSPAAVAQLRGEAAKLSDPDSQAAWWLAACSVCDEGPVDAPRFLAQLDEFAALARNRRSRLAAARRCLAEMRSSFEVRDGVAWSSRDGGTQGAYIAGHDLGVTWSERYGVSFVGTFWPSLGLEDFEWSDLGDPASSDPATRLGRSGPVGGSRQFVKACDRDELDRVLLVARAHLDAMPDVSGMWQAVAPAADA